ncbi:hypothetical protein CMV_011088 [Castanea mollissima]|uniref:Uncharacterized protein n=2 Tax=Castanea mollissima TaxID=60419 RepID=A0A8J4VPG2_9ROSI|nr:hypothetical protein CMV_011088 [Castanea mollissima]
MDGSRELESQTISDSEVDRESGNGSLPLPVCVKKRGFQSLGSKPKPPIWASEPQNSLISNNGMRRAAEAFINLGKSSSNIGKELMRVSTTQLACGLILLTTYKIYEANPGLD